MIVKFRAQYASEGGWEWEEVEIPIHPSMYGDFRFLTSPERRELINLLESDTRIEIEAVEEDD